ncbi:TonB-dependent siderophore receptor [Chryseobacterium carnipullorum]|uniref:TonB-dependent siderophore receptor n=1 Tax=Chryseobacterium carnipullorum TaxID=1124835 RepID=UPI001E3836E3|nr:TonB-dependent receptor plug domain-containing protein [Chryseobacterium carnipullorum]
MQTPLIELPQNVQSISGQVLNDQITLNMSEGIVRNVSGARKVEHWDNVYSNVFMRGASIATYMNGMNVSSTWGPINPDASIIDRIEFVKGPAGFMGSMGDPAGFYNIVTKKPTGKFANSVRFTTGSYNLFRGEADLDGVIVKDGVLDYRLNLMGSSNKSWSENDKTSKIIIAPSITFRPTKTTTFTAQYNYQYLKFNQPGAYLMSNDGYASLNVHTNFNDPNFKKQK